MDQTPLATYLEDEDITQTDFAEAMTLVRGWPCTQPQVSLWASGDRYPSNSAQEAIERASKGKVSRKSWKKWMQKQLAGRV